MAKAMTAEEVRQLFLSSVRASARHWAEHPKERTVQQRCDGLAFSILSMFDGSSMNLPRMEIVLRPLPEDKQYCIENDEDWFEDGQVINDCVLHEEFFNVPVDEDNHCDSEAQDGNAQDGERG